MSARLLDALTLNARLRPDALAIATPTERCSHAELLGQVLRLRQALEDLGVGPGSRVGLISTNRVEWLVAAHAVLASGASLTAFNTWAKAWDLDHMLTHSRCEVLIAVDGFGATDLRPLLRQLVPEAWSSNTPTWQSRAYPDLRHLVLISDESPAGAHRFAELVARGNASLGRGEPEGRSIRGELVLYTSGSTSKPKAVRLTQADALHHAQAVATSMGVRDDDVIYVPVPLFWSYGGANALMVALCRGCPVVVHEVFDAAEGIELIERERCTVAYLLPNITSALLESRAFSVQRVATLERGMTIGPPAAVRDAAERLGVRDICNAYGSTEMYGGATVTPHDWDLDRRATSQGLPLPGNLLRVVDPVHGHPVADGEVGEIEVAGLVSPGYLDEDEAPAQPFRADGTFRTGDLGYLDGGELRFVGRASEMIRSGGINISPLEVEQFLVTHDDVADVAVVGVDSGAGDEAAVAFVRLTSTAKVGADELLSFARDRIASYKVPRRIVIAAEDFPRTSTGKLARSALRDQAQQNWEP